MTTLEQKLQATLGAQLLAIIKLETAVDELQAKVTDLTAQLDHREDKEKEAACSQQSQE